MQRLLPFTTGSFLVAQCPSKQKSFVAEILNFFGASLLTTSRPLRITFFVALDVEVKKVEMSDMTVSFPQLQCGYQ